VRPETRWKLDFDISRSDFGESVRLARRHRQRVEPAFEASLDRLALNYWDLYLIHYSIGKTLVEVFGLGGTAWHGSAYNA